MQTNLIHLFLSTHTSFFCRCHSSIPSSSCSPCLKFSPSQLALPSLLATATPSPSIAKVQKRSPARSTARCACAWCQGGLPAVQKPLPPVRTWQRALNVRNVTVLYEHAAIMITHMKHYASFDCVVIYSLPPSAHLNVRDNNMHPYVF